MLSNVNVIVIEGEIKNELELKHTIDGLALVNFSIVNQTIEFINGEKTESSEVFNVSAWGKLAEVCATYLKNGSRVIVSGKIRRSSKKKNEIRIVAQDVKFLPKKGK